MLGQSEYTVDSDAHNIEVLVTSNTPVTFEIIQGADWISDVSTKSTSTDKYMFSIAKNGSYDLREGEIVFRSTELGLSEKVRITQMQKDAIVIAKSSYQIGNEGGDVVVELGHNVDFGISIDCNWVHQVQTKALQTRNLIFSVDSNPGYEERKATVTFTSSDGKISQAVEIKQGKNVELLVSQNEFLLGYQSRTFNLEVYSNEEYSIVMPDVDWLHKVETKALDWKSNTFMVDANDAPEVRTAQIVVLNEETGKSLTVQIIQYPVPQIILSTNFVEMDAEGGEFYVDVKSNVPFVVMYSQYYNIVTTDTPETFGTPVETTLHFMVSKNTEPFVQFATILFFDISGTLAATVEVKLAPNNSLETLPPIEEFTDLGRESITQINFYAGSDVTTDRYTNNGQLVYAKTVGTTLNLYTPSGKFKILDGREYFLNCSSLKSVDLTSWDTSECKYMSRLFYGCRSLEEVNLEGLDTHLAEDFTYMFSDCHKLKTVDLSFLKGAKCGTLEKMFAGIRDFMTLETVDLSGLDLSVLRSAHCMFQLCVYLKSVKLGDWNVPSTADLSGMFGYVAELSICDVYCSRTTAERLLGSDANCGINLRWHLDNGESFYRSSDYSKDGQVTLLQQATRGKGINIVLFGDGYSDRMISNGIYRSDMTRAMEHLFSQEPLRSYRDCFNVYEVTAVSESEYYYYGGSTAFSAVPITPVEWDEDKCMGYVKGIVGEDGLDAAVGIILMNTPSSVTGTAVMKKPSRYDPSVDYASGFGMLAASRGASDDDGAILLHEFGHAFAKLDEEYVLYTDSCSEGYIEFLTADMWMGWWSNVDFTSDLSKIKWSSYVHDDRYSSQHIGAYEGASHYAYGVWKPTEESIMNSYHPDFNAPSRETFYRRINKLAFGAEWEFDLEEFKVWDTSRPKTVRARRRTTSDPLQESPYLKSLQKQVKDYRVLNR